MTLDPGGKIRIRDKHPGSVTLPWSRSVESGILKLDSKSSFLLLKRRSVCGVRCTGRRSHHLRGRRRLGPACS